MLGNLVLLLGFGGVGYYYYYYYYKKETCEKSTQTELEKKYEEWLL